MTHDKGISHLPVHEQDIKTQAQLEQISSDIKANQALTSNTFPINELSFLFEKNINFQKGCNYLATKYESYKCVRGDGNCYYRAFLYSLCQKLYLEKGDELQRVLTYVKSSIDTVEAFGYDRFAVEAFHEEMVDLLGAVASAQSFEVIHQMLNEENATSDYCVWYLRVITAAYMKADADRFIHFLDDPNYFDVETFCQREIDPMGRETTMVGVLALAEAFNVTVKIEYLDGREMVDEKLVKHSFGSEGSALTLIMLYRPGHYDILYN
jgi:ubiquitin thioesterase protein OTUB1